MGARYKRVAWSPDGRLLAASSDDNSIRIWDAGAGVLCKTLQGHYGSVYGVAWSPDGRLLASGSSDDTIRIWELASGTLRRTLHGHSAPVLSVAWSLDGRILASGSDDGTVRFWGTETGAIHRTLAGHAPIFQSVAWSPNGRTLAAASDDMRVLIWDAQGGTILHKFRRHSNYIYSVAWSPDGERLASSTGHGTISLWNVGAGRLAGLLEGHTDAVTHVSFSWDGRLLASKSKDNSVRLWRCDVSETVAILDETHSHRSTSGLAFHPREAVLATLGDDEESIRIWKLDISLLLGLPATPAAVHYTNAKIVLVGDSGVGKSGLGIVLASQPFVATESTHGRHVRLFDSQRAGLGPERTETRETLLWDLAGQPGYRLIHQLHLNEVAVAVVVFDSRSETDPFAGVRHWIRALRLARSVQGDSALPMKTYLVAARVDRGGIGVGAARIEALVRDLGFDGYFETSAKQGWGIAALAEALRGAIAWEAMPRVSSTETFEAIKSSLAEEQKTGSLLRGVEDLYRCFVRTRWGTEAPEGLRDQFETCIGLVESRGLIRRLSFGDLVLLQPDRLDAYASAMVDEAKSEPDGLGCLAEEDARAGRFRMPAEERLSNKEQEKLLLIATVEDLLRHEIALREQADDGPHLVFPSQMTREHPDFPNPPGQSVLIDFEGPVQNVYATLAVRLSHSGLFRPKEMWRNAASFSARVGGTCGISLREVEDGRGELALFFDRAAVEVTRFLFEEFVLSHLRRRALPEGLRRRRLFACPQCEEPIAEGQARRRRELGHKTIRCPVCETELPLLDREERLAIPSPTLVTQMDRAADAHRERDAAASILQGKIATDDYDVLICHNHQDKVAVQAIADRLQARGLLTWVDEQEMQPGISWYDFLERQVERIKAAAIFVGAHGIGPSQRQEIHVLLNELVPRGRPVIPVLLPDTPEKVDLPMFIRPMTWVDFRKTEPDPLGALIWGITSTRDASSR